MAAFLVFVQRPFRNNPQNIHCVVCPGPAMASIAGSCAASRTTPHASSTPCSQNSDCCSVQPASGTVSCTCVYYTIGLCVDRRGQGNRNLQLN